MMSSSEQGERWWIFDKPLLRDPLFLTTLVVAALGYIGNVLQEDLSLFGRLVDIPLVFFSCRAVGRIYSGICS
jgi:hypothetical protein